MSAREKWRGSYSAADYASFASARTELVRYATKCVDALGGDLPKLLGGAVNIPYVDTAPSDGEPSIQSDIDIAVTRIPSSISGPAGSTLTYNLLIENLGPDPADTPDDPPMVTMFDNLFADTQPSPGVTIGVQDDPNFGTDNCFSAVPIPGADAAVFCSLGENLNVSSPPTYWSLRVTVTANDAVELQDNVDAYGRWVEKNKSNNRDQGSIKFTALTGLSISASGPSAVIAGNSIVYNLSVFNAGPSKAESVVIKDFLPPEVDLTSVSMSSGTCSNTPGTGTITCNAGDMTSGTGRTVSIVGKVKPNVADGTVIFNDSQVSSRAEDSNNGDNVDTVATTVDAGTSGLTVSQSGPPSATAGDQVTYTATVTNVGQENANNVVAREFPPAELDVLSISASSGECNPNGTTGPSCNIGTLAPSGSATVTVVAKVRTNTPDGTTIFNSVQGTSDAFESSNGDNMATTPTLVEGAVSGLDVGITGPVTAVAGTQIDYDIVLNNVGVDQATNVQLKDVIPSEIDLVGFTISQGNCGATGNTVTCNVGTLPASAQVTATVQGIVKANVADGTVLLNTVSASGTVFESNTGDNAATASTTVDAQADLSIDTVDSTDPVNIDTPFRWINTITNAGPSDATGVVVIDSIPHLVEELKLRVLPSGCDRFEETIKCSLGTIKAGATVTMNVELEAMVNAGPAISHTVEVSSLADDPDLTFNSDTETTTLQAPDMVGAFTSITTNCDAVQKLCQAKGKFKVTNAGNAKSVQSALRFVYSANTTLGSGDPQLKKFTVNQLKAGESQEFKFNLVFPINQYLIAQVDSSSQIAETNEANNLSLKGPFPKP